MATTNAAGAVVGTTREYEPYGYQMTPAIQDGPGYTGHVQDAATGLTYMQQRYYDPHIGIFISTDPVTALEGPFEQFHRHRYGNGNPYTFTDPDGRRSICKAALCDVIELGPTNQSMDKSTAARGTVSGQ